METRAVGHYIWTRTAVQTWLMVLTLTMALWATAEAATPQYTFTKINLGVGQATELAVTGMGPTGLLVGTYYDPVGGKVLGFRGLGTAFRALYDLMPQAINAQGQIVGFYWAGGDDGKQEGAGFICGPRAINNVGDIVGDCHGSTPAWALVDGAFHEIQVPGARDTTPLTITDQRQVGGTFCRVDDTCSGFILTLVTGTYQQVDVPGAWRTEVRVIDTARKRLTVNSAGPEGWQAYFAKKR
jgi:hypothetical protein